MTNANVQHQWNDEFCSCGSDSATCQVGGERKCGSVMIWREGVGNVCAEHTYGIGGERVLRIQRRTAAGR